HSDVDRCGLYRDGGSRAVSRLQRRAANLAAHSTRGSATRRAHHVDPRRIDLHDHHDCSVLQMERPRRGLDRGRTGGLEAVNRLVVRSEEHTSELQSLAYLVCRLLLEKKKNYKLISV